MRESCFIKDDVVKQFHIGITVVLSIFIASTPAIGQNIYRWTDEQGHTHFSNAPVKEAQSVDDELPPASNFGGAQNIFSSPEETPSTTTPPSGDSPPNDTNAPDSTAVTPEEEPLTEETANEESLTEGPDIAPQESENGE